MFRVYWCLSREHDLRLVGLALLLCALASFTSMLLVTRSGMDGVRRRVWLAGAGTVTGVGIWSTHYTAMLGYSTGLATRFDPGMAALSIIATIALSIVGWTIATDAGADSPAARGVLGGLVVGLGLVAAHYLDMLGLSVAGRLFFDHAMIATSVAAGVSLCALAGGLIHWRRGDTYPVWASLALSFAVLSLHFIGMAAIRILPDPAIVVSGSVLGVQQLGGVIVTMAIAILGVALAIAIYDRRQVLADAALSLSEHRYRLALQATDEAIWDWSHDTDWIDWSEAMGSQLGHPEARSGTGLAWWLERVHPDDRVAVRHGLDTALADGSSRWGAEYRFRKGDDSYADVYSRGQIVRDDKGVPLRSVGAMLDISERKLTETALRWTATHDVLTGLPSRALFNERLAEALAAAAGTTDGVGLILLDIDDFKMVNDTFGHGVGDALLRLLGERLVGIVPPDAFVARLGGDEFGVILPRVGANATWLAGIGRALAGLDAPLVLDGRPIDSSTSIGGALWPADGADAGELLKSAAIALRSAKAEDRGAIRTFTGDMRVLIETQAAMLTQARSALQHDRILPFYQPKVDLRTGAIAGFEALLRWSHQRDGMQPPSGIAAAFEDMSLAALLTDRMIDRVVRDVQGWLSDGVDFGRIAVNGSAADFLRGDFSDRLLGALHKADVPPSSIEIEVTESVFVGRLAKNVERTLNALSEAGVTIALDDFGTGYASLSHLRQFPVDVLKIDKSFVHKIPRIDDDDIAIIRAVVSVARTLRITTVAEGVETCHQATQLQAEGCDLAQGFLFNHAVTAARVPALLAAPRFMVGPAEFGSIAATV